MGGNTHGSGMGDPLAVEQNQVGYGLQPGEGPQQKGSFPEGEQAGDVGKRDPSPGRGRFPKGQVGIREEKKGGIELIIRKAIRHIRGGDGPEFFPGGTEDQSPAQFLLNPDGFRGGDFPGVGGGNFQCFTTERRKSSAALPHPKEGA